MDSTTDKERNDYPKWPASKGPSYFPAFLRLMSGFMMRIGLYVFAQSTVAELPPAFPKKEKEVTAFTEEYGIDSPVKYKHASMKAFGYLGSSIREYPQLCDIIHGHHGDYVSSLKAIEVYVSGNIDKQIYDMRIRKMPALFEQCKSRSDVLNLIIKANALNHDISIINGKKAFTEEELRERLLDCMQNPRLELVNIYERAFTESTLLTWDGLCSHLNDIIRPSDNSSNMPLNSRGTMLAVTHSTTARCCFKCGASGAEFHPSRHCTNSFQPCSKCSGDERFSHCTEFHDQATRQNSKQANLICWRCGGNHLSRNCNVPCKCDTCGKNDHSTAYHDIYDRIVNKNKKAGNLSCVMRL